MDDALPDLDLASALTVLGDAVSRHVLDALDGTGLRHGHGYLVQRLVLGPATATEMAEHLGVTQQAVSKSVRELVALGHVETVPETPDRRRRPVRLTARGRRAVESARAARRDLDDRIRAGVGDHEFERLSSTLLTALDVLGLSEQVRHRAVQPRDGDLR